jgi:hypothetical protein
MIFSSDSTNFKGIISEFSDFLKWEALLLSIEDKNWTWDISAEFVSWNEKALFTLIR